jgi:phosphoribosylformylglycinamidine synthase subunit PurS
MKFKAEIDVMPLEALLDPQGKAVTNSMKSVGLPEIDGVRIGRHIRLFVEASSMDVAKQKVDEACKKLLANQIMESYTFSVEEVK